MDSGSTSVVQLSGQQADPTARQGTDLRRLCTALAVDGIAEEVLHRQLRWYGFHGFIAGLEEHLEFLIALEPSFRRVGELYPALSAASRLMLQARDIRAAVRNADVAGRLAALSGALALPDEPRYPLPLRCPIDASDRQLLLLAATYLLVRVWHGHAAGRPACHRVLWTFAVPQDLRVLFDEDASDRTGIADLTVEQCSRQALERCQAASSAGHVMTAGMSLPNSAEEFDAFLDLLACTDAGDPFHPKLRKKGVAGPALVEPMPTGSEEPPQSEPSHQSRSWGNRSSHVLADRELLPEWTYGLSRKEAVALAACFTKAPGPATSAIAARSELLSAIGGFLSLASCLTASSLAEAAEISVFVHEAAEDEANGRLGEGGYFTVARAAGRLARGVKWRPRRPPGLELVLEVENLDLGLSVFHRHCTLDELSPIPIAELRLELLDRLGKQLGRSRHQSDLCVKHSLAREIFAATANRGLVSHLCTGATRPATKDERAQTASTDGVSEEEDDADLDEDDDGNPVDDDRESQRGVVRVEALSSYIHPGSSAVRDAYRNAVRRIRYPAAATPTRLKPRDAIAGAVWIAPADMSRLMAWLAEQGLDRSGKSAAQHHNDFVVYVAALLVVQTGHRRAEHLFPFAHDWSLEDLLAFLADKIKEGSEARFVPLTSETAGQIGTYLSHVSWLLAELDRSDRALADAIRQATGLDRPSKQDAAVRYTGPLFLIRHGRPRPVSTATLGWAFSRAAKALGIAWLPPKQVVPVLRRNLATWLADDGVGGGRIEALLGHVRQMHPFGAASSWVPLVQFEALREPLARYTAQMGAKAIAAPWARLHIGRLKLPQPRYERSALGYEGRAIEADEASLRARQAILAVVPEAVLLDDQAVDLTEADADDIEAAIRAQFKEQQESCEEVVKALRKMLGAWRSDAGYAAPRSELLRPDRGETPAEDETVDDDLDPEAVIRRVAIRVLRGSKVKGRSVLLLDQETVDTLRTKVAEELASDPRAQKKVLPVFAQLSDGWRRTGVYRVTAASVNLARFAPGPVHVTDGRHLALARAVVQELPARIAEFLRDRKACTTADRLGVVAVLLVCCDAVLNRIELEQLLTELQLEGLKKFMGQLQLRAGVSTAAAEYDRTVDLTSKSAAAVCGYLSCKRDTRVVTMVDIEQAADRFLRTILRPHGTMSFDRLLKVMRPFWYLRLPGSVFATACGKQECTAPSEQSMSLLLGAQPTVLTAPPPEPYAKPPTSDADIAEALAAAGTLLKDARGDIARFQGASRQQRKRLRKILNGKLRPELRAWMSRSQIVELWVDFIYYLLEVGGDRADTFSFNTIATYEDRIQRALFVTAWDVDLLACDADRLARIFRDVIARIDAPQQDLAKTPLRYFMRYMHQWWGAPNTRYDASTERRKRVARSVVVPMRCVDAAIEHATRPEFRASRLGWASAALLGVNHAFGLRTLEGFGLLLPDFLDESRALLRVRRNVVRSLKTIPRTIPVCLADGKRREALDRLVGEAGKISRQGKGALFADPDRPGMLYEHSQLTARGNWAVKRATGDEDAIMYSLRHTFATGLMSHCLMPETQLSAIAKRISVSLTIPSGAMRQWAQCAPGADQWPHQVDRLALWLGQVGPQTVSTTYWHGAWWTCGEYCAAEARKVTWSSEVMGALLGVSDSAFRHRFPAREDGRRQTDAERTASAVAAIVEQVDVPLLDAPLVAERPEVAPEQPITVLGSLDAMLLERRAGKVELDAVAAAVSQRLGVPHADTKKFFQAYQEVGGVTSFLDFEPGETTTRRGVRPVEEGGDRRARFAAQVLTRMSQDEVFCGDTRRVLDEWALGVDGDHPCLISRTVDDMKRQLSWLKALGYRVEELTLTVHRATELQVAECSSQIPDVQPAARRPSRAAKIGAPTEFALSVDRAKQLPSGRDFHRVLFALACAACAGLLPDPSDA